jgi:hypothetical protein
MIHNDLIKPMTDELKKLDDKKKVKILWSLVGHFQKIDDEESLQFVKDRVEAEKKKRGRRS